MERYEVTGVSVKNNGISLNKQWYTLAEKPAKYIHLFKNGDQVEADIKEDMEGKEWVTFIKKISSGLDVASADAKLTTKPDYEEGAAFGMCCNQALSLLIARNNLKEEDTDALFERYKALVKKLYATNKDLREEILLR